MFVKVEKSFGFFQNMFLRRMIVCLLELVFETPQVMARSLCSLFYASVWYLAWWVRVVSPFVKQFDTADCAGRNQRKFLLSEVPTVWIVGMLFLPLAAAQDGHASLSYSSQVYSTAGIVILCALFFGAVLTKRRLGTVLSRLPSPLWMFPVQLLGLVWTWNNLFGLTLSGAAVCSFLVLLAMHFALVAMQRRLIAPKQAPAVPYRNPFVDLQPLPSATPVPSAPAENPFIEAQTTPRIVRTLRFDEEDQLVQPTSTGSIKTGRLFATPRSVAPVLHSSSMTEDSKNDFMRQRQKIEKYYKVAKSCRQGSNQLSRRNQPSMREAIDVMDDISKAANEAFPNDETVQFSQLDRLRWVRTQVDTHISKTITDLMATLPIHSLYFEIIWRNVLNNHWDARNRQTVSKELFQAKRPNRKSLTDWVSQLLQLAEFGGYRLRNLDGLPAPSATDLDEFWEAVWNSSNMPGLRSYCEEMTTIARLNETAQNMDTDEEMILMETSNQMLRPNYGSVKRLLQFCRQFLGLNDLRRKPFVDKERKYRTPARAFFSAPPDPRQPMERKRYPPGEWIKACLKCAKAGHNARQCHFKDSFTGLPLIRCQLPGFDPATLSGLPLKLFNEFKQRVASGKQQSNGLAPGKTVRSFHISTQGSNQDFEFGQ